jgi:hypothetical protein
MRNGQIFNNQLPIVNLCRFYLRITQYNANAHNTHIHSLLWTHVRKPYSYEHLQRTEPVDLEIHEVTTGASLLTGTSPTTKSIAPLNPRINPGKYEHPCQVEDLKPVDRFHHKKSNHLIYDQFTIFVDLHKHVDVSWSSPSSFVQLGVILRMPGTLSTPSLKALYLILKIEWQPVELTFCLSID